MTFIFLSHSAKIPDSFMPVLPKRNLRLKSPKLTVSHSQCYSYDLKTNLLSTSGFLVSMWYTCFFCGLIVKLSAMDNNTYNTIPRGPFLKWSRELKFLNTCILHQCASYFDPCSYNFACSVRRKTTLRSTTRKMP